MSSTSRHRIIFRLRTGAGIMEADHHQVTTVFTVQQPLHHRHSTNRVLSLANDEMRCDCTFVDDGNIS